MSDTIALYVSEALRYGENYKYIGINTDNVIEGNTYIVIFGGYHKPLYKLFVKEKDIKILYNSGWRWNNAHRMFDRTPNICCVVFERVSSSGKNSSV